MATAPLITVTLTKSPDSVSFRAPAPETPVQVAIPGVVHRTQAGSLVRYQIGPARFEATLEIPHLTNAQKNSLDTFFRTHWAADITYTDERSRTFTVKFLDTALAFTKVTFDLWTVSLHFEFSSIPL